MNQLGMTGGVPTESDPATIGRSDKLKKNEYSVVFLCPQNSLDVDPEESYGACLNGVNASVGFLAGHECFHWPQNISL